MTGQGHFIIRPDRTFTGLLFSLPTADLGLLNTILAKPLCLSVSAFDRATHVPPKIKGVPQRTGTRGSLEVTLLLKFLMVPPWQIHDSPSRPTARPIPTPEQYKVCPWDAAF